MLKYIVIQLSALRKRRFTNNIINMYMKNVLYFHFCDTFSALVVDYMQLLKRKHSLP